MKKEAMKTSRQLEEMYRDLMGCKCIPVDMENVQQFVDYCYDHHDQVVFGGAVCEDGKKRYLYIE